MAENTKITENFEAWSDFVGDDWKNEINVRAFIQQNYTPYEGDESFLAGATERNSLTRGV